MTIDIDIENIGMEDIDLVAKMLVGACVQTEAETMSYTIAGLTMKGVAVGDWEISVKRTKKPV